jgi:hypothetical protein
MRLSEARSINSSNLMMLNEIKLLATAAVIITAIASTYNDPIVQSSIADLFKTPDSLGSVAIGVAEGTRTTDGGKTAAYDSHTDPGNGANNQGTFSYQQGASSAQEADRKQLATLNQQVSKIQAQAQTKGIALDKTALVNGADLANQSPAAALSSGGYIDRLKQCQQSGKTGSDAVLCARTESYKNPATGQYDAPGLGDGNAVKSDQQRRMNAIADTIER